MHFSGNNTCWFVWDFFFKPLSLSSIEKSKMLLYSKQQIFGPGETCLVTTVTVLNKGLGREKEENGRRLCLGPAGVSEKKISWPPLCQNQPKEQVMFMLYADHMPLTFFSESAKILHCPDGSVCIIHFTNTNASCLEQSMDAFESNSSKDLF